MKVYLLITCILFGLLTLVHVWRLFEEGPGLAKDPGFLLITAVSAALCLWSIRLLRGSTRTP